MTMNVVKEAETAATELEGKYLTFWTDEQLFAVPIADVVQIVGMQEITAIPEFPPYARGIISMRGDIIPIIDMRLRLGKMEVPYNDRTCIIVTNIDGNLIGFVVDAVEGVNTIPDEEIAPPPQMANQMDTYLTGIGRYDEKNVLLLDARKLVGNDGLSLY